MRPSALARAARPHVAAALPAWLAARALVLMSLAAAHLVGRHLQPIPDHVARHLHQGLLGWDAVRYRQIAEHGYSALPVKEIRFFPLLPALARGLGTVLGGRVDIALYVLASIPALALGALLHRLVLDECGDEAAARRTAWFVAMVPPAFVLVWGYSEALAMALAAAGFLALRRRQWWWAAAAGVLGALTRPIGLLFMVPAAVEAARGMRHGQWREADLVGRAAAVVAPAVGCGLYLLYVGHQFGDRMLPFRMQQSRQFRGPTVEPFSVFAKAVWHGIEGDWRGNTLHVPWVVLVVALLVVVFRRLPLSYGAWALAVFTVTVCSNRWGSFERYAFSAFPITIALALLARDEHAERGVLVLGAAAMAGYSTLALLGAYVP